MIQINFLNTNLINSQINKTIRFPIQYNVLKELITVHKNKQKYK